MKAAAIQARIIHGKARSTSASRGFSPPRTERNGSGLPTGPPFFGGVRETGLDPEFFRLFFELAPDAVLVVDRSGKILRMNKQSELMFGYCREVLSGKSLEVLLPKVRQFRHSKHHVVFAAAPGLHLTPLGRELQGRRSDGAEFPVDVLCNPVGVGSRGLVLAVVRDITEQKRMGEQRKTLRHDLGERVKELAALHALRDLLQDASSPTPKLLGHIAALLPAAWQYPQVAAARLIFGRLQGATPNFVRTRWSQRADFSLTDGTRGVVEIVYLKPRPKEDEGPFLAEERSLINSVAETLRVFFGHRRMEEELRQSEERFRRALRHSPIAVFNQDRKLRYTWAYNTNPPSAAQSMLGKTDEDLFPPREASMLTAVKRQVLKTGESAREEVRVTINGNPVFYDLAIEPLRDSAGKTVGVTSAAFDITKRKRAEAERSFLASVVESSEDAIFVRTLEGIIVTWNAGAQRMFGYSAQEAVGRSVSILIPADRAGEVSRINTQIKRGERMEHYETVRLRKDGSQIYVSLTNSPMRGPEGKVNGVSTIARDITKRKQLEMEILETNETLQRRVGQDLHDGLSQQLRGIAYLSHVLHQTLAGKSLAEAQDAARITELLQQAISEARDLARGLAPLRLEADGLMSALSELAAGAKSIYGISCRFACTEPVLIPDRSTAIHLYRIAQEALQNAIKHGDPKCVVIDLTKTGTAIRLTVTDDGRGLPKDFMSRSGMGFKIMDYRSKTIGAVLELRRPDNGGTLLSCLLPAVRWNTSTI